MWSLGVQKQSADRKIGKRGTMALALLAALGWWAGSASAAILNVGTCVKGTTYPTIGAAVYAAKPGDTVSVCPGTYKEIVTIDKNLTLIGKTPASGEFAEVKFPYNYQCAHTPYYHDCPQIIVKYATANIEHLHINGYGFDNNCYWTPVGILFYKASGSAQYNTIKNEDSTCEEMLNDLVSDSYSPSGIGIWSDASEGNTANVLVQGNYIDNVAELGVYADGVRNNVTNNSISEDYRHNLAIYFDGTTGSSALNNTIWGTGGGDYQTGIAVDYSSNTTLTRNSITDVHTAIDLDHSGTSTLNTNTMTDVTGGMRLTCASNNKMISNSVTDQPSADGIYGANLYDCEVDPGSDNNLFNGNKFNGLCAGILKGTPDNTGNTFISNTFTNIGPGMNMMDGNVCPAAP
ncbi:MAG TPA: right-handed parallel beta-helix repeat-containing protein [Candidatus Acidoferrum sp.]|nr:right-handed parallel beta-helix repeat-containing protein [Candidatus Acidoferrum sp.]